MWMGQRRNQRKTSSEQLSDFDDEQLAPERDLRSEAGQEIPVVLRHLQH